MKKLFLFAALFIAAAFSSCSKHDNVEAPVEPDPIVVPEPEELAIAFIEGNSLQFDVDETKIVHYTITGGSGNNVVKAELQTSDEAYTVETASTSTTEGTITITAQMPDTENSVLVTVSDGSQTVTAEITVSTNPVPPIPEELAIAFAEGNSLELYVNEPKTIHYTITGGSENIIVKAELQTSDDTYTVETAPTSATEGTIMITTTKPTNNRVIVTVSDGSQTVTATIDVTVILKASFDGKTAVVVTPGTLSQLLASYDTTKITELTVTGDLNDEDIATLKNLPNLAILDMEHANLEVLPDEAFKNNTLLKSVKLPTTLKTIGNCAFQYCNRLTSLTIPDSVTLIEAYAFWSCHSLTSITIPDNVTSIGDSAFSNCNSLTNITIPNSVTTIGDQAFRACSGLTSVTIGNSVKSIGLLAFEGCHSLTSITFPDSVTSILGSFSNCFSLTSITIPAGVTTIWDDTFAYCRSLASVYCKAIVPPSVRARAFYNISATPTLYVPTGSKAAYAAANGWKEFTTIIETEF